ncbi:cytochrome B6, partial [Campylobacter jejuni]|nr:cytochrome B6 [Campylobacter jejuni]
MKKIIMILCLSYANIVFAVDMITPIPNSISYDKEKAKLGKSLYMDKSL